MLKAIIIDDISEFRDTIRKIVLANNSNDISIVAEANCVKDGELAIKKHEPDIVFLDIEMPDGTGFDLLQKFNSVFFKVIFITAYQEFSIKAFKFSAVDYILKPIDKDELQSAIERAKETIDKESLNTKFQALFSTINSKNNHPQKLVLKTADRIFSVNIDDIIRCEADKSYTTFYLVDEKKIVTSKTMKEYDELLSEHFFFRSHQSHLINMKFFDHFVKKDGGLIVLKDKSEVPVSSRKKDELISLIDSL